MSESEKRKVGERGQITLPKSLREKLDIHGGDEVVVHEEDGKIVVEKHMVRERLAEGYRSVSDRSEKIAKEMEGVSKEANEYLGDAPEW
ncbi:MAG: AbrB/MazE/SpoVT family DNA-binding domain-containing protein [Halobacteria archaeon]|nr:AbrB/MazE/SpoVT family DNA-binding domain-containing protein [Halobacteria archaeon]